MRRGSLWAWMAGTSPATTRVRNGDVVPFHVPTLDELFGPTFAMRETRNASLS